MKRSVAIIGGGVGGLMVAATLDPEKFDVSIYEKNFAPARKFLVAGDGGLNLTHAEETEHLVKRYFPSDFLSDCVHSFDNNDLRTWFQSIGVETYVGTSKRIFPEQGVKPIDVLNAILEAVKRKGVHLKTLHTWLGWTPENNLIMKHLDHNLVVKADYVVFSLGGGSWARTGSDGTWMKLFQDKGIRTVALTPSNCAYNVAWDTDFVDKAEGQPLKNISVRCGTSEKKGELMITKSGIEGGAIYALSPDIRLQLKDQGHALIFIDLKPSSTFEELNLKLTQLAGKQTTPFLKDDLHLSNAAIALLKSGMSKEAFMNPVTLASNIKSLPLKIIGSGPIDDAISTAGGIALDEVDESFQLRKLPHHYVIGEMLDWDAPTGGYLLQACFSMGHFVGKALEYS